MRTLFSETNFFINGDVSFGMPYSSLLYLSDLEASDHRSKLSKNFLTKFVTSTVAYMTSYWQNVPQPYLIVCGNLQHNLPHPDIQSAISRLSIRVCYTASLFSLSSSLNAACCSVVCIV